MPGFVPLPSEASAGQARTLSAGGTVFKFTLSTYDLGLPPSGGGTTVCPFLWLSPGPPPEVHFPRVAQLTNTSPVAGPWLGSHCELSPASLVYCRWPFSPLAALGDLEKLQAAPRPSGRRGAATCCLNSVINPVSSDQHLLLLLNFPT